MLPLRKLFAFLDHRQGPPARGGGRLDRRHILSRWLAVTRRQIPLPALPAEWDGAAVAHLGDLHVGPICGLDYVRRIVEAVNAERPDVVVFTGDLVNNARACGPELGQILAALQARDAKLAVLGNHDCDADPVAAAAVLAAGGFEVLHNDHRLLRRGAGAICVAGVDDYRRGTADLDAALTGVGEDVPRILLQHNPDYAAALPPRPRVDLALCGHTHGGQIALPLLGPPLLSVHHRRYGAGLARNGRCLVYTTRGLGMVYLPIRWNCRPELPVLTLRSL